MKIYVTDLLAPFRDSVFKFNVHLQVGELYGVNKK